MNKPTIYGLVPVGGKGLRLGLPYSKEMLPQKNFDYYNPIINHLVQKMLLAGATRIVFVHGTELKNDIVEYFNDSKYDHICQENPGFANVLQDFYDHIRLFYYDKILFGLPDSIFDKNPFVEMLDTPGIVCGLFTTDKYSRVDRVSSKANKFIVKSVKTDECEDWFWGILKFDASNLRVMVQDAIFDKYTEIGDILNQYKTSAFYGDKYIDLGTWHNYNRYLQDRTAFSNNEIEKKYNASGVRLAAFATHIDDIVPYFISSKDYYYTIDNPNVEFLRYREKSEDAMSRADITIKNFNSSQLNRFELSIPLSDDVDTHNVRHTLNLMGAKFQFEVEKQCCIFKHPDYTLVMYEIMNTKFPFKIIEIELNRIDFNLITKLEEQLSSIPGFDPSAVFVKSKYQLIKEALDDSAH